MTQRVKEVFLWFLWVYFAAQSILLHGHGFTAETQLYTSEGYYCLGSLAEFLLEAKTVYDVDSGPVHTGANEPVPITHVARGTSNCYVRFAVGPSYTDVLCCSPQQKFYIPAENVWKEASALVVGDELLTKFGHRKQIHAIDLIQQPTDLYAIAVPEPHIFCIGNHGIVTHNMIIPGVMLSVSIPWGFEAGVAMMSSFLGPLTWGLSLVVGGAAFLLYKCCSQKPKVHQYELTFNVDQLAEAMLCRSNNQTYHNYSSRAAQKGGYLCICEHACDSTCSCICSCPCGFKKQARNCNKRQQRERNQQNRKYNNISKSQYFETIKDRYRASNESIWELKDGKTPIQNAYYLEWDHLHNEVEAYDVNRKHLGTIEPCSNSFYKQQVLGRTIRRK